MTDINHPSEAEMMSIRNIFDRAANAIVQASELAKTVAELQSKFDAMARDLDLVKDRNASLETALSEVRAQRDTAIAERDQVRNDLSQTMSERNHAMDVIDSYKTQVEHLQAKLDAMTNERDYAVDEWHKADTGKARAEEKLRQIQHALGLPETQPTAEPITDRKPDAVQVPISQSHDEAKVDPLPEPEPSDTGHPWSNPAPVEPWKHD